MELKKIDALTSIRFFATLLVVFAHSGAAFLYKKPDIAYIQAVSFYFILSGFILTYVYPSLNSKQEVQRFLIARFARIWPIHFFCFLLVIATLPKLVWVLHSEHIWPRAITNLLLIQAWIPRIDYFFSFDTPSWSLSTEWFLYLCFPLLITRFRETWLKKLSFSIFLLIGMICLCKIFHLVDISRTPVHGISVDGLMYVNPISRLFEFVLGMCIALLFSNLKPRHYQYPTFYYTVVEIIILACVIGSIYYAYPLYAHPIFLKTLGWGGVVWLNGSGGALFAAALILIMAIGRGIFSQLLSTKIFVRLGEITFALYLVHIIILQWFLLLMHKIHFISPHVFYLFYWVTILLCSFLIYKFIEEPARKFILRRRYRVIKTYPMVT